MASGAVLGLGDVAGRVRTITQSIGTVGFFPLEFPEEYQAFGFQIHGAVAAARSVLVGFGVPEVAGQTTPAAANDVLDPIAWSGLKNLVRRTRWVFVYVATATPGAYLSITGYQGEPIERAPSAAEIAAAIAAAAPTVTPSTITWGAPLPVVTGAASGVLLNANASRKAFKLQNTGAVPVYFRLAAAAAVAANDLELLPDAVYEEGEGLTLYKGEIRGISPAGAGEVRVIEAT